MSPSLTEFRDEFQELLLDFLWRQWSALGVAGHAKHSDPWIIDPEALLLITCTLGRHDPRLFDEMLDWVKTNGTFINTLRLKRILRTEQFSGARACGRGRINGQRIRCAEVEESGGIGSTWKKFRDSVLCEKWATSSIVRQRRSSFRPIRIQARPDTKT